MRRVVIVCFTCAMIPVAIVLGINLGLFIDGWASNQVDVTRQGQPKLLPRIGPIATDFTILPYHVRWEGGALRATVEVRNDGQIASGVQIEVVARDAQGTAIDSISTFPGGAENIPPGGTRTINRIVSDDPRATSVTVQVVSTPLW